MTNHHSHKYLVFQDTAVRSALANELAAYILNRAANQNFSISKYKKLREISGTVHDSSGAQKRFRISFNAFADTIKESRTLPLEMLPIPTHSPWLDPSHFIFLPEPNSQDVSTMPPKPKTWMTTQMTGLIGGAFPIVPTLTQEGFVTNSFLDEISSNILSLRNRLVEESEGSVNAGNTNFLNNLRMFLNESVSVIEIMLHQIYFKAKYDPLANWKFDEKKLGSRHGRRIADKLKWIFQITGMELDAAEEVKYFMAVKDVRNHLNHFDPPCFAYELPDLVYWINSTTIIGRLIWKIRSCCGLNLSKRSVELITARTVQSVPFLQAHPSHDVNIHGYASCSWNHLNVDEQKASAELNIKMRELSKIQIS